MGLPNMLFDSFDRLPVLSKFEFFARSRGRKKSIDISSDKIEAFKELKSLRDAIAHPKRVKTVWEDTGSDQQSAIPDKFKKLDIDKSNRDRTPDEAIIVMRHVHLFLRFILIDTCKLSPTEVSFLFFSDERNPSFRGAYIPSWPKMIKSRLLKLNIDLGYFRIDWSSRSTAFSPFRISKALTRRCT